MKPDACDFEKVLSLLPVAENPKQTTRDGVPYILHEDHRWVLPIVHFAQENGFLPRPCTVVMYDRHTDSRDPFSRCGDELQKLRLEPSLQGIVSLCENHLLRVDDDWLKAGMQLGLFGDAVIFGSDQDVIGGAAYTDDAGEAHRLISTRLFPRHTLGDALLALDGPQLRWEILGWEVTCKSGLFLPDRPKVFLTIDLDCFAIPWDEYTFAWPNKMFEGEFSTEKTKIDWNGRDYVKGLASKAGLVAIAREHGCCGGTEDAETILQKLIHYGFDGQLSF